MTISLRVTNLSADARPTGELRNVTLAGDGSPPTVKQADDTIAAFDPGLPVDVVVDVPLPPTRTLTLLLCRDPPAADPLSGQRGDQPGVPVARVTLDVEPAR